MIFLLLIVVLVLLVFAVIVASLLLIPFGVSLQLTKAGASTNGALWISWLGLVFTHRDLPAADSKSRKKKGKREKRKGRFDIWRFLSVVSPDSIATLSPIFSAVRKSVHVQGISAHLEFGLDDPADTAVLSGYLWSVASVLNAFPKTTVSVTPDFVGKRLDGSISARLKVRLLRITISFIRAFTKQRFRELIGEMRS